MGRRSRAFTLIELLIVVAIIAILALIAVPNFLEAQVRAKHARVVSEMRTIATALEAYYTDANDYPLNYELRYWTVSLDLSTPVAYLASVEFIDPFAVFATQKTSSGYEMIGLPFYGYHRVLPWFQVQRIPRASGHWPPEESTDGPLSAQCNPNALRKYGEWRLLSIGPDRLYMPPDWESYSRDMVYRLIEMPYDPTNGTISWGNICRTQISPTGQVPDIRP